MKIKVLLAIFLCLLSIGTVSATLLVREIAGSTGIGYRAATDTVGINVSSTSDVTIGNTACLKQGTVNYICAIQDTATDSIMTYYLENSQGDQGTASIKVDNGINAINYVIRNDANGAELDYDIQDSGFDNNNACSGIKTLKVYDNTALLNTVDINGAPGTCSYQGTVPLSVGNSGVKSIRLEVTDNVGNVKSTPVQNITVDLNAPEIVNGLILKYSGTDESIGTISNSATLLVDIYFSIREDNLSSIVLDLSGANSNPAIQYAYKNLPVPLSNCIINNTAGKNVYECRVNGIQLRISGSTLEVGVTAKDVYSNVAASRLTKSFTIDNVQPKVTIETDICDSIGRCYIHNGQNKIILPVNKQNFNKRYIFFNIPGSTFGTNMVQNCTGSQCTANISLTCDGGSQVEAFISSFSGMLSQDDAGNVVEPFSTYLYCDNSAPRIDNISVTGESSTVIREIASGSTLKIKVNLTEYESEDINAYAWLDKLKNATEKGACTKYDVGKFECVWTVSNINAGYYDANILINVSDVAGNMNSKLYTQKVFGYKSDNQTPDNLDISFKQVSPAEINRIVVDMATSNNIPYYVYAKYDLRVVKGNNVAVLHQTTDLSKCIYKSEMGTEPASAVFSEAKLNNIYAGLDETGRIDFRFNDQTLPNLFSDEFTISCNISVTVREGKEIYKNPQILQLDIPFKLVNSQLCDIGDTLGSTCTPGEALGAKIERAENDFRVRASILGKINDFMPKLQRVCDMRNTLSQGSNAALIMSMVANGVAVNTQNVKVGDMSFTMLLRMTNLDACFSGSGSASASGSGFPILTGGGASGVFDPTNMNSLFNNIRLGGQEQRQAIADACKGLFGQACDFVSCTKTEEATGVTQSMIKENYDALTGMNTADYKQNGLPDLFGGGSFGEETREILTANINVPDVSNSIVMAAATQCWPAVIYNAEKYRQVECNYLYCLKMAAYTGTDVSACDQAKKTQYCTMIFGEIFELPYINAVTNIAENAADYVSNFLPLAAASGLKKVMCPNDVPKPVSGEDIFTAGKIVLPKTVPEQTYRIYMCHVPLQIARFADTQRRSAGAGDSFRYPEIPDMCEYAKCVGEENCAYEPTFWDDINKIKLPVKDNTQQKIDQEKNKKTAEMDSVYNDLLKYKKLTNAKLTCETKKATVDICKSLYGFDAEEYKKLGDSLSALDFDYAKNIETINNQISILDENIKSETTKLLEYTSEYQLSGNAVSFTAEDSNSLKNALSGITDAESELNSIRAEISGLNIVPSLDVNQYSENLKRLEELNAKKTQTESTLNELNTQKIALESKQEQAKLYAEASSMENNIKELESQKSQLEKNGGDKAVLDSISEDLKNYNACLQRRQNAMKSAPNNAETNLDCTDITNIRMPSAFVDKSKIEALSILDIDKLDKNIGQKLEYYTTANNGLKELNDINKIIGVSNSDLNTQEPDEKPWLYNGVDTNFGELRAMRTNYYIALGLCSDKATCDTYVKNLADATSDSPFYREYQEAINKKSEALQGKIKEYDKAIRTYNGAEKMGDALFVGLQYLNAQHMIDWFFTDYWTEKIIGVDISDTLDPNKWKDSLCNPTNRVQVGGTSSENNVISCEGGFCQPVLTYAVERTELQYPNQTKYYIYTSIYYISGGDLRGRNVTYNIYLTGPSATLYGFRDDAQLNPFAIVQKKKVFKAMVEFDTICVRFSEPFPVGNTLSGAREYCRPITANEFDTGSPWKSQEEQDAAEAYLDEYDESGKRVTNPNANTVDTRPPGIFED